MSSIIWSVENENSIRDIKKEILKKKIIMSFIINSYSKYDKIFRYIHLFIAAAVPVIGFASEEAAKNGSSSATNASIVLGSIVAIMIKIKDYLKFDKLATVSKQQTVKYEQLYVRIDREMAKPVHKRQAPDDFIYWIDREFNNIEMADPDFTESLKHQYIAACKDRGIPCDDDLDVLGHLINTTVVDHIEHTVVDHIEHTIVTPTASHKVNTSHTPTVVDHMPPTMSLAMPLTDVRIEILPDAVDNIQNNASHNIPPTNVQNNALPTLTTSLPTLTTSPIHNIQPSRKASITRPRSNTDNENRINYNERVNAIDPKEDLQWAMDRLKAL